MTKEYALQPHEIVVLAPDRGACYASDRITVDGCRVGYCYREAADFPTHSGWTFLSGDETQEYVDLPEHWGIYDVNTIANYDREILGLLDVEAPAAFERTSDGGPLRRVE
jgi:hypothetical protein